MVSCDWLELEGLDVWLSPRTQLQWVTWSWCRRFRIWRLSIKGWAVRSSSFVLISLSIWSYWPLGYFIFRTWLWLLITQWVRWSYPFDCFFMANTLVPLASLCSWLAWLLMYYGFVSWCCSATITSNHRVLQRTPSLDSLPNFSDLKDYSYKQPVPENIRGLLVKLLLNFLGN